MNLSDDQLKKLEAYYSGEMTPEEEQIFLSEINSSEELKKFVEIYENIDLFEEEDHWPLFSAEHEEVISRFRNFSSEETRNFSKKLKETRKTAAELIPKKKTNIFSILSGVAAILIVAFMIVRSNSNDLSTIYAENSHWNEMPSFNIKGAAEEDKLEVQRTFTNLEFSECEKLASQLINSSSELEPDLLIYLGVSQLEQNKFEESLKSFDILINSDAIDQHKGYWYQSLVYLKMEDETNSLKSLKKVISDDSNYNYTKAKRILEQLE